MGDIEGAQRRNTEQNIPGRPYKSAIAPLRGTPSHRDDGATSVASRGRRFHSHTVIHIALVPAATMAKIDMYRSAPDGTPPAFKR
jgi:hypothetical protein